MARGAKRLGQTWAPVWIHIQFGALDQVAWALVANPPTLVWTDGIWWATFWANSVNIVIGNTSGIQIVQFYKLLLFITVWVWNKWWHCWINPKFVNVAWRLVTTLINAQPIQDHEQRSNLHHLHTLSPTILTTSPISSLISSLNTNLNTNNLNTSNLNTSNLNTSNLNTKTIRNKVQVCVVFNVENQIIVRISFLEH